MDQYWAWAMLQTSMPGGWPSERALPLETSGGVGGGLMYRPAQLPLKRIALSAVYSERLLTMPINLLKQLMALADEECDQTAVRSQVVGARHEQEAQKLSLYSTYVNSLPRACTGAGACGLPTMHFRCCTIGPRVALQ